MNVDMHGALLHIGMIGAYLLVVVWAVALVLWLVSGPHQAQRKAIKEGPVVLNNANKTITIYDPTWTVIYHTEGEQEGDM